MHFLGLAGKFYYLYFNDIKSNFNKTLLILIFINFHFLIEVRTAEHFLFYLLDNQVSQFSVFNFNLVPISISLKYKTIKNIKFPNGPHIKPHWLNCPVRVYDNPNYYKNLIGSENKKRSIIYQWVNLITGKIYIGSAWNGSTRLLSYWRPSVLKRNYPIYQNINYYGIHNFALAILEDLGISNLVKKEILLSREQFYLDRLFSKSCGSPYEGWGNLNLVLNLARIAGSTKGYKHKPEFGLNRKGKLNAMYGRTKSKEFIEMQNKDKSGCNNPLFGTKKSATTIAKLTKLVYVYNLDDMSLIGEYSTVNCSKLFKIGKDTLTKNIKSGLPFKGKIFLPQSK